MKTLSSETNVSGKMSRELSADSGRRWNISAPTENHIDALELADGTVRSPTTTAVRSWEA